MTGLDHFQTSAADLVLILCLATVDHNLSLATEGHILSNGLIELG